MNSKVFSLATTIVISILFFLGIWFVWSAIQVEVDPVTGQAVGDYSGVDNSVAYSTFLFYASIILVLAFTVWGIVINPKKFIPSLVGVIIFGIIFFICYGMASSEPGTEYLAGLEEATESNLKWGDTGILMTYALVFVALALLVVQIVRNALSYFSK